MIERRRGWRRRYRELVRGGRRRHASSAAPDGVDDPRRDHDNFWLTSVARRPETVTGWSADDLRLHLEAEADIEARPLWKPMHLQPVFADLPAYTNGTSERLFRTGLSLPSGSALTDDQFERVVATIRRFLDRRSACVWREGEALSTLGGCSCLPQASTRTNGPSGERVRCYTTGRRAARSEVGVSRAAWPRSPGGHGP